MALKPNWIWSLTAIVAVTTATLLFQNCQNNGLYVDDLGFNEINRSLSSDTPCPDPLEPGQSLSEGEWRLAFKAPTVASGDYCHAEKRSCIGGKTSGKFKFASCSNEVTTGYCGSPFPGGNPIAEGKSVVAYEVTSDKLCRSSTRVCSGGFLSGQGNLPACPGDETCRLPWGLQLTEGDHIITSDREGTPKPAGACGRPFIKWACTAGQIVETHLTGDCNPGSCNAPWGERVENGASVVAFKNNISTDCDSSANRQVRRCTNGVLGGNSAFDKMQCFEDRNPCALPWGETLAHGQSVYAYNTARATGGSVCDRQVLSCDNGRLNGPAGTHKYKSCTVSTRSCASPFAGREEFYIHLQTVEACREAQTYGNNFCNCTAIQCIDGTWNNPAWRQPTCVHEDAACDLPWGGRLASGGSVVAYADSTKTSSAACNAASNKETRFCTNGSLSGSFRHQNCTVVQADSGPIGGNK